MPLHLMWLHGMCRDHGMTLELSTHRSTPLFSMPGLRACETNPSATCLCSLQPDEGCSNTHTSIREAGAEHGIRASTLIGCQIPRWTGCYGAECAL